MAKGELQPDMDSAFPVPPVPSTSSEYITVLAHFHRAEIARMAGWRDRIDRTTNWAITGGGAMLSLSLSTPASHHSVLLFTMLLVLLFLVIEARRYRFFDVYRARVRLLERNYLSPLLLGKKPADGTWAKMLGDSLASPVFLISLHSAMGRRLRRNYIWIFLIVLFAWVIKIATPSLQDPGAGHDLVASLREATENAALGFLPGWLVITLTSAFYIWLLAVAFFTREPQGGLARGEAHV